MITNPSGTNQWSHILPQERIYQSIQKLDGDGLIYQYTESEALPLVLPNNNCWKALVRLEADGYARIRMNGKRSQLHVYAWKIFRGSIPQDLVLDHLCLNKACANPDHLEPVTRAENDRRARFHYEARRTHCKRGHELTPENVKLRYVHPTRTDRQCRTCLNESKRKSYHRKKAELL
jgi:hypothetical protein